MGAQVRCHVVERILSVVVEDGDEIARRQKSVLVTLTLNVDFFWKKSLILFSLSMTSICSFTVFCLDQDFYRLLRHLKKPF